MRNTEIPIWEEKKKPNIILALRQEQMLVILNRYMVEHALNEDILYIKVKIRLVMSTSERALLASERPAVIAPCLKVG